MLVVISLWLSEGPFHGNDDDNEDDDDQDYDYNDNDDQDDYGNIDGNKLTRWKPSHCEPAERGQKANYDALALHKYLLIIMMIVLMLIMDKKLLIFIVFSIFEMMNFFGGSPGFL